MFARLFTGRNGPDQIALVCMVAALVFNLIPYGFAVSLLLLAYALFRMFSRNVVKRRAENYKFVMFWQRQRQAMERARANLAMRKMHKVFSCPQCGQKLRVPRGKGKIHITCSRCKNKFAKQT